MDINNNNFNIMDIKQCTKCGKSKPGNAFRKREGRQDNTCRSCQNLQNRDNRKKRKDGYTTIYYLPEEHYIGLTNDVYHRMLQHKHDGKHVDDVEIIAKFVRHVDAKLVETMFHVRGYNGYEYSNATNLI